MSIVDSSPRYATAVAKSRTGLIAINEVILRNAEPMLCLKLYKNLSSALSDKLKKKCEELKNKENHRPVKVMKNIDFEKWRRLLRKLPFFRVFSDEELTDIINVCEPKRFMQSENIVTEEKVCDTMYFIIKGSAEILKTSKSKGKAVQVGTLHEGTCFGETGVLLKKPRSATIRAIEKSYILKITGTHIENLSLEIRGKFFRQLASDICVRLLQTAEKMVE